MAKFTISETLVDVAVLKNAFYAFQGVFSLSSRIRVIEWEEVMSTGFIEPQIRIPVGVAGAAALNDGLLEDLSSAIRNIRLESRGEEGDAIIIRYVSSASRKEMIEL